MILASWGIAFFEYWLAVPANRCGSAVYTAAQLKTMQEVITLVVFAGFSVLYLGEPLGWNHALGFALIAVGVVPDLPQMRRSERSRLICSPPARSGREAGSGPVDHGPRHGYR